MSDLNEGADVSVDLTTASLIQFSLDFSTLSSEGEKLEDSSVSILLTTIDRLGTSLGDGLGLGDVESFYTWSAGEGVSVEKQEESIEFKKLRGIAEWKDLNLEWHSFWGTDFPLVPTDYEINECLNQIEEIEWFGVREHLSNRWMEDFRHPNIEQEKTQRAASLTMQIDVLLKSSHYPRGRLCICFKEAFLWVWVNQNDDYLMILSKADISENAVSRLIHCGESFLLL